MTNKIAIGCDRGINGDQSCVAVVTVPATPGTASRILDIFRTLNDAQQVKALSVRQPWAYLICCGLKDVENRSWKTAYRGTLYIHAGLKFDWSALRWLKENGLLYEHQMVIDYFGIWQVNNNKLITTTNHSHFGAIVGRAVLTDCVENHQSKWSMLDSKYQWLLKNPACAMLPFPVRGKLRLFSPFEENLKKTIEVNQ